MVLLGKITKVHGYGGAVMVKPVDYIPGELKEMEWVFIEIEGKPVPFFISSLSEHASGNVILKFENYDSSEVMKEFTGCSVFLKHDYDEEVNEIKPHLILTGFKVFNKANEFIGTVNKVMSLPMQYMLVLEGADNTEKLIPLNEGWILEIDKEAGILTMDLPEGLVNINP
ncbi:MAG: ribosome maturation factor RimM [Bacteroidales bacterium]|nr:ribosome maturation factor RimM [Bacteroidales bacterium]